MTDDGVRNALVFATSAWSSYSGCRQYREDMARAQAHVGDGAPALTKIRQFFNHPGFIESFTERVQAALDRVPEERRNTARLLFTAHSIPTAMAELAPYEQQVTEAARLVAASFPNNPWEVCWQSRSGPPQVPWLEPDVCDVIEGWTEDEKPGDVVITPIGFISDHLEVLFDLDEEAREACEERGIGFQRAGTPGTHPAFVGMIRELIEERTRGAEARAVGQYEAPVKECDVTCCAYTSKRPEKTKA
jgi:ferrochelatase